jgi:hypothetical protein
MQPAKFSGAAVSGQGGQNVKGEGSFVDTEFEEFALKLMSAALRV